MSEGAALDSPATLPLRPRVRARTREGASSASKWTGTGVPRNAGFLPMILPINRSLVGARVERFSSARRRRGARFKKIKENQTVQG